jgi:hypothetical protein
MLGHLLLVLRVVEPIENLFCHKLVTSFRFSQGRLDRLDLPPDPLAFPLQQLEVGAKRRGTVLLSVEDLGDGRKAEAEVTQEQDPLQAHEGALVLVAIAVATNVAGFERPDLAVVAQGAARGSGRACDVLDRPLHRRCPP